MGHEGTIFEGRTLEDAVKKGLEALGLSRAEVMITMVEEGSSGFLGIGSKPYRVRVMPRPGGAIPEPVDRGERDRARRGGGDHRGRRGRPGQGRREESGAPRSGGREARRRNGDPGGRPRGRPSIERGPQPANAQAQTPRPAGGNDAPRPDRGMRPEREPRSGDRDRERGGRRRRGRRAGAGRERGMDAPRAGGPDRDRGPGRGPMEPSRREMHANDAEPSHAGEPVTMEPREPRAPAMPPEQLAAEGRRLTEELMRHMQFEATVNATAAEDRVDVMLEVKEGEDLLTGRRGEVRQALQHVLNLMLNRGGRGYHLQLEINDFWQRREVELEGIARQLAEEALASGAEAVSEYLNAQERRILHVTLREDKRVKTYALGTGLIKRVAVAPADFPSQSEPEDSEH